MVLIFPSTMSFLRVIIWIIVCCSSKPSARLDALTVQGTPSRTPDLCPAASSQEGSHRRGLLRPQTWLAEDRDGSARNEGEIGVGMILRLLTQKARPTERRCVYRWAQRRPSSSKRALVLGRDKRGSHPEGEVLKSFLVYSLFICFLHAC